MRRAVQSSAVDSENVSFEDRLKTRCSCVETTDTGFIDHGKAKKLIYIMVPSVEFAEVRSFLSSAYK